MNFIANQDELSFVRDPEERDRVINNQIKDVLRFQGKFGRFLLVLEQRRRHQKRFSAPIELEKRNMVNVGYLKMLNHGFHKVTNSSSSK